MATAISLNHEYSFSINTVPTGTESFADVSQGFANLFQTLKERAVI